MAYSKVGAFLDLLPEDAQQGFQRFLSDSSKEIDRILEGLLLLLLKGESEDEVLYADLYPDRDFAPRQISNLKSKLLSRLRDFLIQDEFERSNLQPLMYICSLSRLGAKQFFPSALKDAEDYYQSLSITPENKRLKLQLMYEASRFRMKMDGRQKLPLDDILIQTEELFVLQSLYYMLAWTITEKILGNQNAKPPIILWDLVLQKLNCGHWLESEIIQVYFSLYQLVSDPTLENIYPKTKELLCAHSQKFERSEANQMYAPLINYCIQQYNHGMEPMIRELFLLYKEMQEREVLVIDGKMNPWSFKSAFISSLYAGEPIWAETFLNRFITSIPEHLQPTMQYFCWGVLAYYRKDLISAEREMNNVLDGFEDPFFGLDARSYLLKIYYETANHISMETLCTSFRLYVQRNKQLPAQRLQNYMEFIRFFRRLMDLGPLDKRKASKLKKEVEESNYQANKPWLLAQLANLMG